MAAPAAPETVTSDPSSHLGSQPCVANRGGGDSLCRFSRSVRQLEYGALRASFANPARHHRPRSFFHLPQVRSRAPRPTKALQLAVSLWLDADSGLLRVCPRCLVDSLSPCPIPPRSEFFRPLHSSLGDSLGASLCDLRQLSVRVPSSGLFPWGVEQ